MGDTCVCLAEGPKAGIEVQSLDPDCPKIASFPAALAVNPVLTQRKKGFIELVQQFVPDPKTHVQMWKAHDGEAEDVCKRCATEGG